MVVGIDGGALAVGDPRLEVGVYKIVRRLLEYLPSLNYSINYRIYKWARGEWPVSLESPNSEVVTLPRRGYNEIWLLGQLRVRPVNAYFGISQIFPGSRLSGFLPGSKTADPVLGKTRMIGFIYDLAFLFYPEAYPGSAVSLTRQTADLVRRSTQIITISEATKKDIIEHYNFPEDRISVCYPGIDLFSGRTKKAPEFPFPYFLFVGALKKSKNVPVLLEAFKLFRDKTGNQARLVIAGGDYWYDGEIEKTVSRLGLGGPVRFLGHVAGDRLPGLYKNAVAFVSPSLREGFCLPAAEALACGCPVVGATTGAFAEVVGKNGLLTDPSDVSGLARALAIMAQPAKRRKFAAGAAARITGRFGWDRFARSVYQAVLNGQES